MLGPVRRSRPDATNWRCSDGGGSISRIGRIVSDIGRRRVLANAALYIVAAWVAIQVAGMAIDAGLIRWPLRDVFVAAFIGFPIALIVSWFYDITRRGLVRTPPVGADDSFDKFLHARDYLLFVSLAAVWALAIVYVHTPAPVDKSIAILPFENPGQDPDNALFAFGIRVDLQTQLQNITDLKIIARESSDKIDSGLSIAEVGLKLGAAYIMKGSVERVLDRVRINVILIDAQNEQQTWVSSYDRELNASNWFDIRNEISGVITESLQTQLSPAEKKRIVIVPTENLEALQAYFRGKQRMAKRTTGTLAEAVEYFQQAVDLDPEFALAWVGLADSYYLHMLYASTPRDEAFSKMKDAVDKALKLDASTSEAYATLAVYESEYNSDDDAAEAAFKQALAQNPNYASAHQWYGSFLTSTGRQEEGLEQKRRAQALDPLSSIIHLSLGMTLHGLNRVDEALESYETAIEIDPAFANAYERVGGIYYEELGQMDEAVIWFRKAVALDPGQTSHVRYLGFVYLELGDPDRAEFWFKRQKKLAPEFPFSDMVMEPLYLRRGDETKALEVSRKNLLIDPGGLYTLAVLRNDDLRGERYADALARYERGHPGLFQEDGPKLGPDNVLAAIDLSVVYSRMGEQERADLLLDGALAVSESIRTEEDGSSISDVLVHSLRGETEEALIAVEQLNDHGWRDTPWWYYLEYDPNLDSIRGEARFQIMLNEMRADMAIQLEHIRAMDANGELAAIPDID